MLIQSNYSKPSSTRPKSRPTATPKDTSPQDVVEKKSPLREIFTASNLIGAAVIGGIGLTGAALGAYAGYASGALAGIAGTIAGGAGGVAIAAASKGEPVGKGALLGALGGAIIGISFGHPGVAVGLGVAGAMLPVAGIYGLASAISV